jgi:hypothetical protein
MGLSDLSSLHWIWLLTRPCWDRSGLVGVLGAGPRRAVRWVRLGVFWILAFGVMGGWVPVGGDLGG